MYVSGLVVAFILSFIVFFTQGIIKRKEGSEESMAYIISGSLFGALIASLLSWLAVVLLVIMFMGGKVWGISK